MPVAVLFVRSLPLAALTGPAFALGVRKKPRPVNEAARTESSRPGARDEPGGGVVRSLTVAARITSSLRPFVPAPQFDIRQSKIDNPIRP
jgi:hypothetical protein